jgi:ADP-ribose pyrophosphatase
MSGRGRKGALKARVLGRRTLLKSSFFNIQEEDVLYRGKRFPYEYRAHGPVVHIIALTPANEVLLIRQYRHPARRELLELPAGLVDPGETVLAAARRELLEETGYRASRWTRLGGWHASPASTPMRSFYFLARGARHVRRMNPGALEFIKVVRRPFAEVARSWPRAGEPVTIGFLLGIALARLRVK